MNFRVDLDIFRGPLDLLLYLVRKHELEIVDIPIALITDQYLEHLEVLEFLDVNAVGDFLAMASMLVEIKSKSLLPRDDEEEDQPLEDPRKELVRQLLEYKKFKDAASILEDRSRSWQERFPRLENDLPPRERNLADEPIHDIELWDLVSALGRMARESKVSKTSSIVYDDTPIHVYMERIHGRLLKEGRVALADLITMPAHRSTIISLVLAILELTRHHGVRAEQNDLFGEIWVFPGEHMSKTLSVTQLDTYEHGSIEDDDETSAAQAEAEEAKPEE
ncbi:unnamed protein product [Cladocopium goreaui]|uniref:Segregation and condensation protein A n=1 Tax=Cladocopium goreaui TaxID=2562237 RepID=A0A9P1BEN1_9DINO|nr:unnamed protein product [Cladocopium goreaui]